MNEEVRAPFALPVGLKFSEPKQREASWGRLVSLSSAAAVLSTQSALTRGEKVFLSFELAGERFRDFAAVVEDVELDPDGYARAELRLSDEVERRRLAKLLVDVLARR